MKQRLQKIISHAGIASRRRAEQLIVEGRVTVNNEVITTLGSKADPDTDRIEVDGTVLKLKGPKVYILLNKPSGYITTMKDEFNRPIVTDLVQIKGMRLFPVGRLDYDTEGVLLLTNDGDFTNNLLHPGNQITKKYLVKVRGVPDERALGRLAHGIRLEDGKTHPAKSRFIRKATENTWIELTITEGKNKLVKRMCQAVGHPVMKLKRIEFAGLSVGKLKTGEYRKLSEREVERLKKMGRE